MLHKANILFQYVNTGGLRAFIDFLGKTTCISDRLSAPWPGGIKAEPWLGIQLCIHYIREFTQDDVDSIHGPWQGR